MRRQYIQVGGKEVVAQSLSTILLGGCFQPSLAWGSSDGSGLFPLESPYHPYCWKWVGLA